MSAIKRREEERTLVTKKRPQDTKLSTETTEKTDKAATGTVSRIEGVKGQLVSSSSPRNQVERQQHRQLRYQQILQGVTETNRRDNLRGVSTSIPDKNKDSTTLDTTNPCVMGNKLSCSCTPLIKKAYKESKDTPSSFKPMREGRIWAEVFHVSAASGAVRWQQVSDDIVPVRIKCIREEPDTVVHISAYNRQVEPVLNVTLHQPVVRFGHATECFVYFKDTSTGDTWGLNFTSPQDAQQFKELCSPSFKLSRKASSSYSLRLKDASSRGKLTTSGQQQQQEVRKRKPQSTPSSPSKRGYNTAGQEELQCTCMTAEALHRQRNGRVRYTASATLPKSFRQDSSESRSTAGNITAYPSTTSVNASSAQRGVQRQSRQTTQQQLQQQQSRSAQYSRAQYAQSSSRRSNQSRSFDSSVYHQQQQRQQQPQQYSKQQLPQQYAQQQQQIYRRQQQQQQRTPQQYSSSRQPQHSQQQLPQSVRAVAAAAVAQRTASQYAASQQQPRRQPQSGQAAEGPRSKSSDDVRRTVATGTEDLQLDPQTLKKMLYSVETGKQSQVYPASITNGYTPKENGRHPRGGPFNRPTSVPGWSCYSGEQSQSQSQLTHEQSHLQYMPPCTTSVSATAVSSSRVSQVCHPTLSSSMSTSVDRSRLSRSEVGRRRSLERMQCFDYDISPTTELLPRLHTSSEPTQSVKGSERGGQITPTPSSSGDETTGLQVKDIRSRQSRSAPSSSHRSASPTIKVLQEYEQHLRNALAKGNDADTYSLNTFETILSQSMENVVALMKEVQSEIEAIRREESHYRSTADEAVFTHRTGRPQWARSYTLPSRGTSLPPPGSLLLGGSSTGDLYNQVSSMRKQSAPVLDTLSVDGGGAAGMHFLRPQSSFESTASDSKAYLTSSEVSTVCIASCFRKNPLELHLCPSFLVHFL